jgi:predicted ATPase
VTPQLSAALELQTEKGINRYECRLAYAAEDTVIFTDERVSFQHVDAATPSRPHVLGAGHRETALRKMAEDDSTARFIAGALARLRVYQFHDTSDESRLRATCDVDDSRYLYSNGGNLAAMLHRLRNEHRTRYDRLLGTIRMVAPFIDDFVLEPSGNGRKWLSLRWRGRGGEYEFGPHQLSDGTLRFIALATLLLQPADWLPSLIVIDEPELGLHPVALSSLAEIIREAAQDTQLLVATQSASLVDFFEPGEIIVAEREDGASVFRRLDEAKLREWLEDYSLGELWRRNLIAGGPTHE